MNLEPLKPANLKLSQHVYQTHSVDVKSEYGEYLCQPKLYEHVAAKLRVGDEIRLLSNNHSFVATVIVTFVKGTDVRVKLLQKVDLDNVEAESESSGYESKYRGPKKWSIIKTSTGEVVMEDIPTKEECETIKAEYVNAMVV